MTIKEKLLGTVSTETYTSGRRLQFRISLNDGEGPEGVIAITQGIVNYLLQMEQQGFHGAEVEIFAFKKEN